MSQAFIGMDVQGVRTLASQFSQRAQEIDTLAQQLTQALGNTQWVGNDATQFRNDWSGQHTAALRNVAQALRDAQAKATTNANEQEQASS